MAKKTNADKARKGRCPKCDGKIGSLKNFTGRKHTSGSSPDYTVHEETLSDRCPGEIVRSPVYCQYYYESQEELDKARRGSKKAIAKAKRRAKLEREKK